MKPNPDVLSFVRSGILAVLGCLSPLSAQTAPSPAAPAAGASPNQEVIELSPFQVNTSRDVGYAAENTLAGSRLNSALRDTAGSVSVFTKEFLDDLAITSVQELVQYSLNAEMNTNENQAAFIQNPIVNAESLIPRVLIRGAAASLGMDYFTSITPTDPYRVGRYEDSRGPNSILFGLGAPGGLLNESSKTAATTKDTASVRYSTGSWDRSRLEIDGNKVLKKDRLALSVAGLLQENGGWRAFDFQDKKRIFGSVTYRPARTVKLTAMGEVGRDINAVIRNTVEADEAIAWLDNRNARGVNAVTFAPNNTVPTAAMVALGVTARDGNRTGQNRKAIFIENDGTVFDAIGTFLSGSYNNVAVRAPDGTPGVTTSVLRVPIIDGFYPDNVNAAGPGMYREQRIRNFTLTGDWQATRNLAFNVGYNYQYSKALVHLMVGTDPTLRGDANRTLGVNGPVNPYAGQLYFDGNWRRDVHTGTSREGRVSASYSLETKSKWLGRHRFAVAASKVEQFDTRANSWLAFAGRPYNAVVQNPNNRITVRNYITEGSWATYRVGDWRKLPKTINFDGRSFGLVWGNEPVGANNGGGEQEVDMMLGVVQSYFLDNRLVTTFGYRQDKAEITELGFYVDPLIGDVVDRDPSKAIRTSSTGRTGTAGGVFHVLPWLSLIANKSSNTGLPSFVRKVFPDGNLAPPTKGEGEDYGLGFDFLGGRLNAKLVYFKTVEQGRITTNGFGGAAARNNRVADAFAGALVGNGLPYSTSTWQPVYNALTPPATAASSDSESSGYEARIVANITRNWRFVANYSYTDFVRKNLAAEVLAWYGLKTGSDGRLVQGVTQNAAGQYIVNPSAYETGKGVARWLELGAQRPQANVSTLTTSNGQTVAQEIFNLVDTMNDEREQEERRWGLRPHKVSLFTAYDFRQGRLKGWTIGGGWRWRTANVIGEDGQGREITGRAIRANDMLIAYTYRLQRLGQIKFQLNVTNILDDTQIIPVRIATGATAPDGFMLPGNRGISYSRYDLVAPRDFRFTTTWSY